MGIFFGCSDERRRCVYAYIFNSFWKGTITLADGDEFKFRSNHDWGLNYGDKGADGSLEENGDNLKGYSAGTYDIFLYLGSSGFYTYKVIKQ